MSQYQQLSDKFSALQPREKQLVLWVSFGLIVYLFYWFGVAPALDDMSATSKNLDRKDIEYNGLVMQRDALNEALAVDYGKQAQAQLDSARKQLLEVDNKLASLNNSFVAADRMPALLMTLLDQQGDIRLMRFDVLPTTTLRFGEDKSKSATLFRHNMTLVIEGEYFNLKDYLARLQAAPEKVVITDFSYNVTEYPKAQLSLALATVSNNETFISL